MINFFLFLALTFLFTLLLGRMIERIRVPWIFAALIIGSVLAVYNPFAQVTSSDAFVFLAQLGMYFMLFMIGFELDLNELVRQSGFIFKATFFIILFEAFFGSLLVHFVFGYEWVVSIIVALSFATVGEAVLLPILDEFKIINTKLGQSIIGIGTLDDLIEIIALILAMLVIGAKASVPQLNITIIMLSLFILFGMAFGLTKFKESGKSFSFLNIETTFLFVLFLLFLFLGIGEYAHATAVAALLSGVALKTFLPDKRIAVIESEVRTMCYGFFAPVFFLWVGTTMNVSYLFSFPLLVILVVLVSNGAKLLSSWLVGRNHLGVKQSLLMGIGLSVRFSTSIIIVKILFENKVIGADLYSVIVASSIFFMFLVPPLLSNLLVKWVNK